MSRRNLLIVFAGAVLLGAVLSACGGGGTIGNGNNGGNGGNQRLLSINIANASWVAYQDGSDANWQTLASTGGFNGTVPVNSTDGRYSLAFVCEGEKTTVYTVHATHQEIPQVIFTCSAPAAEITVTGNVSGLENGSAIISIGQASVPAQAEYTLQVPQGLQDVIAVRFAGDIPNRVWIHRRAEFTSGSPYNIDFSGQGDSSIQVFDVGLGNLTILGRNLQENEESTVRLLLESERRLTRIGVQKLLVNLTLNEVFRYPIFPEASLSAGERFRLLVETSQQRGVVQVLTGNLPSDLKLQLPEAYVAPTLSVNAVGAVQVSVDGFSYSEPPLGYQLTISQANGSRVFQQLITPGWLLGSATSYTTPVLETLSNWRSEWSLVRGESLSVGLRVYTSPSGATPQQLWEYLALPNSTLPDNFTLRYATRLQTLTP